MVRECYKRHVFDAKNPKIQNLNRSTALALLLYTRVSVNFEIKILVSIASIVHEYVEYEYTVYGTGGSTGVILIRDIQIYEIGAINP